MIKERKAGRAMKRARSLCFLFSAVLSAAVLVGCASGVPGNTTNTTTDTTTDGVSGNTGGGTDDSGTSGTQNKYADGVYDGRGTGKEEGILVHVTIKDGKITDIEVIDYHDTPDYFEDAAAGVIPDIIEAQSTDVEAVSSATYSSKGIIQAVQDALSKAER